MENLKTVICLAKDCGKCLKVSAKSIRSYCDECIKARQKSAQKITTIKLILKVRS